MKTQRSAGDWTALSRTMHKIRANYTYVGVDAADELLRAWEAALDRAEPAALAEEYVLKLKRITQQAVKAIRLANAKLHESK